MKEYTIFHDGKLHSELNMWAPDGIPVGAYIYAKANKFLESAWYLMDGRSTSYQQPDRVPAEYRAFLLLLT